MQAYTFSACVAATHAYNCLATTPDIPLGWKRCTKLVAAAPAAATALLPSLLLQQQVVNLVPASCAGVRPLVRSYCLHHSLPMPAATFLAAVLLLLVLDLLLLGCVELQSQSRKQTAVRRFAYMLVADAAATILCTCHLPCHAQHVATHSCTEGSRRKGTGVCKETGMRNCTTDIHPWQVHGVCRSTNVAAGLTCCYWSCSCLLRQVLRAAGSGCICGTARQS
jgi:hypothetical protein